MVFSPKPATFPHSHRAPFSPSTSSARQDTALLIFLGPVYRWGSALVFWPHKSHSQAQLQHLPFYMVIHFLKIWETPPWPYMLDHVKNGNSAHNVERGLIIGYWLISWECNANSITLFLAFREPSTASLLQFWFLNYCVLSSSIISSFDFFLLLNFY